MINPRLRHCGVGAAFLLTMSLLPVGCGRSKKGAGSGGKDPWARCRDKLRCQAGPAGALYPGRLNPVIEATRACVGLFKEGRCRRALDGLSSRMDSVATLKLLQVCLNAYCPRFQSTSLCKSRQKLTPSVIRAHLPEFVAEVLKAEWQGKDRRTLETIGFVLTLALLPTRKARVRLKPLVSGVSVAVELDGNPVGLDRKVTAAEIGPGMMPLIEALKARAPEPELTDILILPEKGIDRKISMAVARALSAAGFNRMVLCGTDRRNCPDEP